ncbi:thioredoxin family protein [Halomicroarcula sp. GCM10025710]
MVRTAGCAICKSMDPIIDNVARATDVAVVDFNPKADLDAVAEFDVRSVPTFLLFDDGDLIDRMADGFVPTEDLVAFVERQFSSNRTVTTGTGERRTTASATLPTR